MECNACQLEIESLLSDIPSKWRDQLVKVICEHVVNADGDCAKIKQCLSDEMTTLDFGCIAHSQSEWDNLTYLGKWQKLIDKVCDTFDLPDLFIDDTSTVTLTGNGNDVPLQAEVVISSDSGNTLEDQNGLYVPDRPLGTDAELVTAFAAQCTALGDQASLSGGGLMKDITGWTVAPTTVAASLRNLWLTICDMRGSIEVCCAEDFPCNVAENLTAVIS
jgi:hypothetical protein